MLLLEDRGLATLLSSHLKMLTHQWQTNGKATEAERGGGRGVSIIELHNERKQKKSFYE